MAFSHITLVSNLFIAIIQDRTGHDRDRTAQDRREDSDKDRDRTGERAGTGERTAQDRTGQDTSQ